MTDEAAIPAALPPCVLMRAITLHITPGGSATITEEGGETRIVYLQHLEMQHEHTHANLSLRLMVPREYAS